MDNYEVIGTKQTFYPNAAGQFEQRLEVTIKTRPSGAVRFHDFSIDEAKNTALVHDTLTALAASTEAIHDLGKPGG